jgi:hypothetical protein
MMPPRGGTMVPKRDHVWTKSRLRHGEIDNRLARRICEQLGIAPICRLLGHLAGASLIIWACDLLSHWEFLPLRSCPPSVGAWLESAPLRYM